MASVAAAPPPARAAAAMDQKAAVAAFSPGFIQQQQSNQHSKQQQQEQNNGNGQQQQEALRCPRCDSSNTKFCYYNNYSLSQPRHFCKACKRYWTRGGTLRSVPVGGGCRKNKRVRRHPNNNNNNNNNSSSTTNNTSSNNNINLREGSVNSLPVVGSGHPIHDLMISSPTNNNPLYYGSNNHNLMNFPFSRYDLQIPPPPQMNGFGLGFSSSGLVHNINGDEVNFRNLHNNNNNSNNNNNNNNNKQIFQDLISTTTPPTISSFLASTFQMKGGGGGNNNFETILPSYDEGSDGIYTKEEVVKIEVEGQNGSSLDHDPQEWCGSSRNGEMDQQQQMGGSSPSCDPSLIWGSGPNLGAWLDPSTNNNLSSSSLTSLI